MNIKSKTYMQGSEFKERQGSFAFFCARAFEYLVQFKDECIAVWKKMFKPVQRVVNLTMELPFDRNEIPSLDEMMKTWRMPSIEVE